MAGDAMPCLSQYWGMDACLLGRKSQAARRKFFELADIATNARRGKKAAPISPIALEVELRKVQCL